MNNRTSPTSPRIDIEPLRTLVDQPVTIRLCRFEVGHLVFIPPYLLTTIHHSHHPVRRVDVSFGGTTAGDAFARADSWPKVLKFLHTHLPS